MNTVRAVHGWEKDDERFQEVRRTAVSLDHKAMADWLMLQPSADERSELFAILDAVYRDGDPTPRIIRDLIIKELVTRSSDTH